MKTDAVPARLSARTSAPLPAFLPLLLPGLRRPGLLLLALAALAALASPGGDARGADATAAPLARFELSDDGAALEALLRQVLDAARQSDRIDPEDDERQLQRLRAATTEVLATEGYFQPRVTVLAGGDGGSRYLLRVAPGPRASVTRVELEFRGALTAQPERVTALRRGWELPTGQPFRDPQWTTAKSRLLARVQERDFPAAALVETEATVDVESSTVVLRVLLDSGPAFTLGELQVEGLVRYDRTLVERFNDLRPGEPYDAARLLDFQRSLQSGPYFSGVVVDVAIDPAQPLRVPVRVELREAPARRLSFGVGASTNVGPRVEVTYRQVGLIGYPYTLQTGAGVDPTRQIGFADVLLPPKPNGARDSVGVLAEQTDIENLLTRRYAAGVARERRWTGASQSDFDTRLSLSLQRETARLPGEPDSRNDTLTLAYQWTRRTVDSITEPRRGGVLGLRVAAGLGRAGIDDLLDKSFVHLYGRYVRYLPLSARDQVIVRAELGHAIADDLDFVPLEYRFRTGGAGSVRGYPYQRLGVLRGSAIDGARSLAVGSAEYLRWIDAHWGGALFADVGDAVNDLRQADWARGYGLGVRYRTVAGPLALDLAYGERDRKWRVHFSIAISF